MLIFKQTFRKIEGGHSIETVTPTSFDRMELEEKLEIIDKLIDGYNTLKEQVKEIENEH